MAEKRVGLYLGSDTVGAVVVQKQNVISMAKFGLSSLEEANSESLNEDIRWEALINKALREIGADTKKIYVSLSDRDFIFRPLELPLMKKREIESSLIYEIEKYIPFKIDELEWDYGYSRLLKEKKVNVSFIGIRDKNLKRVIDILERLELKPMAIEPSSISLARALKLSKAYSKLKNYALLDFGPNEAYLTFFQNDLPVFNRYLTVSKEGGEFDSEAFIESVNFSFQYFKREFKTYDLEKFIVISDSDTMNLVAPLHEGLQVEIEAISSYDLTSRNNAQVDNVKALGVAKTGASQYKFKPDLRKSEERLKPKKVLAEGAPLRGGLLSLVIAIGVGVSVFFSIILGNQLVEKEANLKKVERKIDVPKALESLSWEERVERVEAETKKLTKLKKASTGLTQFYPFFELLGKRDVLPSGMWFNKFVLDERVDIYDARLSGYVFRNDDYEEYAALDELIFNLRKSDAVKDVFEIIELESSTREKIGAFDVTQFTIRLYQRLSGGR